MGGCFTWEQIAHSSIPLVKLEKKFNGLYGNFITLFVVAVAFWAVPVVVSSPLLSSPSATAAAGNWGIAFQGFFWDSQLSGVG